jgi:hypothetical protein
MTLGFVLSRMLQILHRLWAVDTAQPVRRGGNGFARATGPADLLTQPNPGVCPVEEGS